MPEAVGCALSPQPASSGEHPWVLRSRISGGPRWRSRLVAVIGILLLLAAGSAVGIAGIILGAALLAAGAVTRRRRYDGAGPSDRMDAARWQAADATRRREQAAARCRELGMAADPMLLREIPKGRVQAENLHRWEQHRTELHREVTAAAEEVASALAERGHPSPGLDAPMLVAAAERYRDALATLERLWPRARPTRCGLPTTRSNAAVPETSPSRRHEHVRCQPRRRRN